MNTNGELNRFKNYKKGSVLHKQYPVQHDSLIYERLALSALRHKSKPRTDYGSEYFEDSLANITKIVEDAIRSVDSVLQETSPIEEEQPNLEKYQCTYCKHCFYKKSNLHKHLNICKMKDDPIRQLEIQANVEYVPPPPNTCRFCKTKFTQSCSLKRHLNTCKERKLYQEELEAKIKI